MSAAILGCLGEDDLAFRYGGEELMVLLPRTDLAGAVRAGERVRGRVADLRGDAWPEGLRVTVSVGAAACPTGGRTARDLVRRADEALYRAKRAGKNRVVAAAPAPEVPEDQSIPAAAAG